MIGEGETAETAVPRQEITKGHRIQFIPTHSTNRNNREEDMHLAVQVREEGSDSTAVA